MTNADLQKAFDAGYAAAKALYSILQKGGIEVTEADIRRIVEEVLEETLGVKTEQKETWICQEQEHTGTFDSGAGACIINSVPFVNPAPGKIWVKLNGTVYECESQRGETANGAALTAYIYGEESGTPVFSIAIMDLAPNNSVIVIPGTETTHTIGIYAMEKTIDPIDDNCLPGVCLPVVELSTTISFDATEPQALSTEDGTLIDAVVTKRNPFILALDTGEFAVSAVFNVAYIEAASMYMLSAFFETMRFELIKESGVWYFICYAQG